MSTNPRKAMIGLRFRKGSYEYRTVVAGKRLYFRLQTEDLPEAIKRKEQILANPELVPSPGLGQDVQKFIAYKVQHREFTPYSEESKGYILKSFADFIGSTKKTDEVTTANISAYYNNQLATKRVSTANTYLMTVRSFFAWAVKSNLIRRNPCMATDKRGDLIIKPIEDDGATMKDFCTVEEVRTLIDKCEDQELKLILLLGFHAGLRKQEIIEAVPWWFNMDARRIDLRKHQGIRFKDREERSIPMTPDLYRFLKEYGLKAPYMIQPDAVKGKSKYRYDFRYPFLRYMELHGFTDKAVGKRVTAHIMRHSFASILVQQDVSLYKVAKYLGDNPSVVEKTYAKLAPKHEEMVGIFGESESIKGRRVRLVHRRKYSFTVEESQLAS